MKHFKIFLISISILFATDSIAQEFNLRLNVTSCSTFTVQMQCVNATYLPSNGDYIYQMDISFASLDAFSLTVGSSSHGFSIGSPATGTSNGYNIVTFAESVFGQITTNFTLNTWYDIAPFTITSGSTNIFLTTSNETPSPLYSNYFTGDSYLLGSELGVSTNQGTLAKTWLGGTSTTWSTAANWCPATAPSTGENIIIPNQTNNPILSATTSVGNVEIQSGALLRLNGNQLTVTGLTGAGVISGSSTSSLVINGSLADTLNMSQDTLGTTNMLQKLTVNNTGGLTLSNSLEIIGVLTPTAGTITTGGNLTLAATATGVYGQIDGTAGGSFSGTIKMEKFLTNTNAGWRQFSLPLVGTLDNISDLDMIYSVHGTDNEKNVFFWNAAISGGKATGWQAADSTFNQTRGYSIYSSNSTGGLHDFSQTISHTGTYDKTNRTFDIKATEDPANTGAVEAATGWNLIGNPYPSNLSLTAMFGAWPGNVTYQAVHVWDATSGQYKAILGSGVTQVYNTSDSITTATFLAPFQAFWVKADADVTFTVNNDHRTTSMSNVTHFMKGSKDLARLNVLDKNNRWDQAVVYFESAATEGFDASYDGYKLISMNADVPSLYAVNQDGIFSISALDADDYQHTVPLGFRSTTKGEMSFELDLDELDQKWYVYLEDKELGIFYNIKENPYSFNHSHNSDSRFVLHFQTFALSADVVVKDVQKMKVGGDGEAVYVFVPAHYQNQVYNIEVMDFAGRSVYNKTQELNYGMNTLNFNLNNSAYYIFRITAAEGMVSEKVFLR